MKNKISLTVVLFCNLFTCVNYGASSSTPIERRHLVGQQVPAQGSNFRDFFKTETIRVPGKPRYYIPIISETFIKVGDRNIAWYKMGFVESDNDTNSLKKAGLIDKGLEIYRKPTVEDALPDALSEIAELHYNLATFKFDPEFYTSPALFAIEGFWLTLRESDSRKYISMPLEIMPSNIVKMIAVLANTSKITDVPQLLKLLEEHAKTAEHSHDAQIMSFDKEGFMKELNKKRESGCPIS